MSRGVPGPLRPLACALVSGAVGACATSLPDVEPADIPPLVQESSADP